MSAEPDPRPVVAELGDDVLAEGLLAGAVGECWSERAAVGLILDHGGWLGRPGLRRAVMTELGLDDELFAWVVWDRVDVADASESTSELQLLTLACSLGGVASDRPLSELVRDLNATDALRVLNAFWLACTGRSLTRTD